MVRATKHGPSRARPGSGPIDGPAQTRQSTFAPAILTTCAHFLLSAAMKLAKSALLLPPGIAPCDNSRSLSAGPPA